MDEDSDAARGWERFFDWPGNPAPMRAWLSVFLKGLSMGAADAVPGVSGGTIALITGIYERLVSGIAAFDPRLLSTLPRSYDADARAESWTILEEMDVAFLLVLGAGIATAVVTVTGLVDYAEQTAPALMFAFFFGLVLASAVVLYRKVSITTPPRIGAAVAGFAVAFLLAGATESTATAPPLALVFVGGAIAICAMILPGVSGALLLMLFGLYTYLSGTLHEFLNALLDLVDGGTVAAVIDPGTPVATFMVGAVLGLLTISKVVAWALERYRFVTLAFLVSLMVGALRYPAAQVVAVLDGTYEHAGVLGGWTAPSVAALLVATLVGVLAVLALDRYTDDLDY